MRPTPTVARAIINSTRPFLDSFYGGGDRALPRWWFLFFRGHASLASTNANRTDLSRACARARSNGIKLVNLNEQHER